jgi:hypothetical protein
MATRIENIFRARDLLRRPYPNAPSFHDLFRQEISEEQDICNATNNSGKPWATSEYSLNYTSGTDTYAINVSDWGKCLFVVKETTNPYIPYLPVPFDDLSGQQYGTILQYFNNSYAQAFALTETPERMSFYRAGVLNSQYMVKINPMPQESATYILTYLPGYIGNDDPLESSIQMPEHAELVRLRLATAMLPYAKWHEDEVANSNTRKELAQSFAFQLERKEDLFKKYLRSINVPKMVDISPWNEYA